MKALARDRNLYLLGVLFVASYFRYYQIEEFAKWMNISHYASNYVLDGALDAVQAFVFCVLFWGVSWKIGALATPLCFTVAIEGLQTFSCRLWIVDITKVPEGMTLCHYVTGVPSGQLLAVLSLMGTMVTYGYVYAKQQRNNHSATR